MSVGKGQSYDNLVTRGATTPLVLLIEFLATLLDIVRQLA